MGRSGFSGYLIGLVFILLTCWFMWGFDLTHIPESRAPVVEASRLSTAPRRQGMGDPPMIHISGFDRTCMDCHKLFPPRENPPKELQIHGHIVLNHGINDQCRNCHDLYDRNKLVLRNEEVIPFSRSVVLCSTCHGPTYRDWERGMHGRSSGYWNRALGDLRRLDCVECHDPHTPRVPAMVPVVPLPPPNTLRMGDAAALEHLSDDTDPLRKAIATDEMEEDSR